MAALRSRIWYEENADRRRATRDEQREEANRRWRERYAAGKDERSRKIAAAIERSDIADPDQWAKALRALRSALIRGSPYGDMVSPRSIRERDNGRCYLCGELVLPGQITLDHEIPCSKGGPHTSENLRLAHRSCNLRKQARLLAEISA